MGWTSLATKTLPTEPRHKPGSDDSPEHHSKHSDKTGDQDHIKRSDFRSFAALHPSSPSKQVKKTPTSHPRKTHQKHHLVFALSQTTRDDLLPRLPFSSELLSCFAPLSFSRFLSHRFSHRLERYCFFYLSLSTCLIILYPCP
jgi:hypothetical protein